MEKSPFPEMLSESLHLSRTSIVLLFFGLLIALPLAIQGYFVESEQAISLKTLQDFVARHPLEATIFLAVAYVLSLLGKGGLIRSLDLLTKKDTGRKTTPPLIAVLHSFARGLLLDMTIAVFFTIILAVLSLPLLVAADVLDTIPSAITILFFLVTVPIIVIAIFIRQFSFCYYLLSPIRLKSAFETSMNLFLRHRQACLMFGMLLLIIALLFTFSFNLAMLGIVVLFQKLAPEISQATLLSVGILLGFAWYEAFKQALWFLFFRSLAAPKSTKPSEAEPVGLETRTISSVG